jgi:replicative DNA helicase
LENFNFIESGIIFGLCNPSNFKDFTYLPKDFAEHGETYKFIQDYLDNYSEFPTVEVLVEKFDSLKIEAQSINFNYALSQFTNQVMFRNIVNAFSSSKPLLQDNPKKALGLIMDKLNDVEILYDSDVNQYDSGNLDRYEEWKRRSKIRKMGDGIIGIRTPFKMINSTGIGWQPGDLITTYARPTVGKTWLCCKLAADAIKSGYKTLLVSTEMPKTAISLRMDVLLGHMMNYKLSHSALRNGKDIDEEEYKKFLEETDFKNLLICDHISGEDSISLPSITNLVRKYSPDLLIVDGVYLISTYDKNRAAWEQSHSLFYGLKTLALSTNTAIIASTQATREAAANMFTQPTAGQVAFGDALIRASDVALSMCMIEDQPKKREIAFQKYRDGDLQSLDCEFIWDVDKGRIEEDDDSLF